ncbi:MAG: ATP-binding protein, partial [Chloroflexota bacterium]
LTFIGCIIIFWTVAVAGALTRMDVLPWLAAPGAWSIACLLARGLLQKKQFPPAVWSYGLGAIIGISVLLFLGDRLSTELIAFVCPLVVVIIGLMLSPRESLIFAVLSSVLIALSAFLNPNANTIGWHQFFPIFLTFVSWVLAAQVTGELYQITQWALMNYERERKTTSDLYENRQALERSFRRSQALSEELTDTNTELDKAKQAAEEATRYRGQFLANMSHELRTPLNAIIGFSETMLKFPQMYDEIELPDNYRTDLNQIYNSGRQLLSLINDILDLSKVDAGKMELLMQRVELDELISSVMSTAEGLIGTKPIRLEKDLPITLPLIWADESRIRQVLLNLYSNAVKFTDSGSITLSVREVDQSVRISLKDTGKGIDSRYHEAIFEEFKQAETSGRDPRSGAGLGLAICRHLLGLMSGRIWVESEAGNGSTFHILVSLYRDDATRPTRRDTSTFPAALLLQSPSQPEKVG